MLWLRRPSHGKSASRLLDERFDQAHEQLYGFRMDSEWEVVTLLDEILARSEEETGMKPTAPQAAPLAWAHLESAEDAMKRVRDKAGI